MTSYFQLQSIFFYSYIHISAPSVPLLLPGIKQNIVGGQTTCHSQLFSLLRQNMKGSKSNTKIFVAKFPLRHPHYEVSATLRSLSGQLFAFVIQS